MTGHAGPLCKSSHVLPVWIGVMAGLVVCAVGCAGLGSRGPEPNLATADSPGYSTSEKPPIALAAHTNESQPDEIADAMPQANEAATGELLPEPEPAAIETLADLETAAVVWNPALRRRQHEVSAALARTEYTGMLPEPMLGINVFGQPIETAAGAQRANLTLTQRLPQLRRLDAQTRQVCLEAAALEQVLEAERLQVIADVRTHWYRLYVLDRQIETNRANQTLLESLIAVANARVATGNASQGDVLLGTLELSRIEEQLLILQQQRASAEADLNRTVGRDASVPVSAPTTLDVALPDWSHDLLRQLAWENQPEITVARIRAEATRWGVEVARLEKRPDLSLTASWFSIDDNRPQPSIVDVGRDAWSIGAQVSLPLYRHDYAAIAREADWKHHAAHASVEEALQRYDATLRDLWAQAEAAARTARLYENTILPQARQTLAADQQAYANGTIEFDRVVQDFRNVLTLELGHHRAIGQLAAILAKIRQATGTELAPP